MDEHTLNAEAREHADVGRSEIRPGPEHLLAGRHVLPGVPHVRTRTDGLLDDDERSFPVDAGALHHAHGVGARRQRRSGHDAGGLAFRHEDLGVISGHDDAHDTKARR